MRLTIVLPVYNEEKSLLPLLQKIESASAVYGWNASILIINDGSTDGSLDVVRDFRGSIPVEVVDIQPNRGLANAIHTGLRRAIQGGSDTDVVATLDADDSQNPFLIQRMAQQIAEGSDVVIASRYQPGAHVRGLRKSREFLSWAAGLLFRMLAGIEGVKDYTCGFRAYRVAILRKAILAYGDDLITQKGFGCMVELLLKLGSLNAIVTEVPMILRYDLRQGESKMNVRQTMKQTLALLFDYKRGRTRPASAQREMSQSGNVFP